MPDVADIVVRTVTVAAAILLGGLLLAAGRRNRTGLPGALFCFAVAAFFVTSVPGIRPALGYLGYPLTALCVTKAVWFWLFARALFRDDARLAGRHWALAGVVAAAGTWQQTVFLGRFRDGTAGSLELLAGFGFDAVLLVFVVFGLYEAWRDIAVDLVERRRRLRLGFMVVTGLYLTATLAVQSYNLLLSVSTPELATRANMILVTVGCLVAAWYTLQIRRDSWLEPARSSAVAALNRTETAVLAQLQRAIERELGYLEEGRTIGSLAGRLGTGEHVLRRVINTGMGHRNFNDFLHAFRIREACEELARPERARVPVLSIAMQVGYGSVGAFNRAFKARIGMTPTDYRRSSQDGTPLAH